MNKEISILLQRHFRTALIVMLQLIMAVSLTACLSLGNLFGDEEEEEKLPGFREPVVQNQNSALGAEFRANGPVVISQAYANPNWAQPGGTANNAPSHLVAGQNLKRVWKSSGGAGSSNQGRLTAPPIIAAGRAYIIDARATVRAYSLSSGKQIWTANLTPEKEEAEEGYGGGVAFEDGRLFAATGFGDVYGLDPASGKALWKKSLSVPIRIAPIASQGRVYVTPVNNEVYALSSFDGSIRWQKTGGEESAGKLGSTSPAVASDTLVVPFSSGEIFTYKTIDGQLMWDESLTTGGAFRGSAGLKNVSARPIISKGLVISMGVSGKIAAYKLRTGERVWSRKISGSETPAVSGDNIFLIDANNKLIALRLSNGKTFWEKELPEGLWMGPVLAGGRLMVVSSTGTLLNINVSDGNTISQLNLDNNIATAPVIASGTVYFLTSGASLIAMR